MAGDFAKKDWFDLESAAGEPVHAWVAAMLPELMGTDVYWRLLDSAANGGGTNP